MTVSSVQSGSQAATVGTEHSLGTAITTPGVYVLVVDTNAMVLGDALELRAKTKAKTGSTSRQARLATYSHAQTNPNKDSIPIVVTDDLVFSLKQTAGTSRTFDWNIVSLG